MARSTEIQVNGAARVSQETSDADVAGTEDRVLSDREQRSLMQIERSLRAEDDRFTRSFETFQVDLSMAFPSESERPIVTHLIRTARWAMSIAVLTLIPVLWVVAVVSTGDVAGLTRMLVLPVSALLLCVGLVLYPDRHRRTRPRRNLRTAWWSVRG